MPEIYIPGVRQHWSGAYGWQLNGGPRKMILHSTESDSGPNCVNGLCEYLDGWANPTFVWDPWTGDMAMCGRADKGMGALVTGNNDGSVVIQVEAVGRAAEGGGKRPFSDSPMKGWDKILAWCDSWGIPHTFPAGPPKPYPQAYGAGGGRYNWNNSGYFAHSQVPGNDHGDPGTVDMARIFAGKGGGGSSGGSSTPSEETPLFATVGAKDVGHPLTVKRFKTMFKDINPKADVATVAQFDKTIKQFQTVNKLTADGIIGPQTQLALTKWWTGGNK